MRRCIIVFLVLVSFQMSGQMYEVGIFAGGANNIGDVGRTNFVLPSDIAFGGLFKWNKSRRYAWRASVIYGKFTADDTKSDQASRQQRGFVIDNSILEASAGLEFNFIEYDLDQLGPAFTPYLYTGVTYFRYDYKYFDAGQLQDNNNQRDGSFAIPMTAGVKIRLGQKLIIGAEVGARYTFTDNLDGSNPEKSNVSVLSEPEFGNVFSDDWYVFSGITFTYTFGRVPCGECFE